MTTKIFLPILLASCLINSVTFAQDAPAMSDNPVHSPFLARHPNIRKFYIGSALDGAIFSTAKIHRDANAFDPTGPTGTAVDKMGIIRFTWFVNLGLTFNFNFSPHVGMYTGVDIKNIGYIEQNNGYTLKRRVYNIGAPLGLKIGNMGHHGNYFFAGGGLDVAINFQEKLFKERDNKTKINEWWSDRTPRTMPYAFIGGCFRQHVSVKLQYYMNNFMNTDYQDNEGNFIYQGTDVHLILLSVGFNMHFCMKHDYKDKDQCTRGQRKAHGMSIMYGND
jgi:hypothetical protein